MAFDWVEYMKIRRREKYLRRVVPIMLVLIALESWLVVYFAIYFYQEVPLVQPHHR